MEPDRAFSPCGSAPIVPRPDSTPSAAAPQAGLPATGALETGGDWDTLYEERRNKVKGEHMAESCANIEKCGFFLNYKGNTEVVKAGWATLYCLDKGRSDTCERKKLKAATGKAPPDNMTPTGRMLMWH
jgi:hypothetical protein